MSKQKAKVASKNNPEGRGKTREYFYNEKKIKPVKVILDGKAYFSAEYEESGELVVTSEGVPLSWSSAKYIC